MPFVALTNSMSGCRWRHCAEKMPGVMGWHHANHGHAVQGFGKMLVAETPQESSRLRGKFVYVPRVDALANFRLMRP